MNSQEIGLKGEELAKDILRKEGFFDIHHNSGRGSIDQLYYSDTFDFYTKRREWGYLGFYRKRDYGEREYKWVIDVKATRGDLSKHTRLTINQVIFGYVFALFDFKVGILKINIDTRKYKLLDVTETVLWGLHRLLLGFSDWNKIDLSLLKKSIAERLSTKPK